jgi:hypothetical protein
MIKYNILTLFSHKIRGFHIILHKKQANITLHKNEVRAMTRAVVSFFRFMLAKYTAPI